MASDSAIPPHLQRQSGLRRRGGIDGIGAGNQKSLASHPQSTVAWGKNTRENFLIKKKLSPRGGELDLFHFFLLPELGGGSAHGPACGVQGNKWITSRCATISNQLTYKLKIWSMNSSTRVMRTLISMQSIR